MKSVRISEICWRYFRNLYFENKQAEIRAIANENTVLIICLAVQISYWR